MRISTRIRSSALFASALALTVGIVLLVGLRTVEAAIDRGNHVTESLNEIFELSMLTTDYLINYEPRAERQWIEKQARLGDVLDQLTVETPEDEAILERVRENLTTAGTTFSEITLAHEKGLTQEVEREVSLEYQSRLTARLLIVMQGMVSDSVLLGEHASARAQLAQQITITVVLAISMVGVLLMIGIGFSADRSIVRPLVRLRDSALRIGRGNLNVQSGITSSDEVGEFARAFDGMVADLRRSYAMLENEIAERRRAEQALEEYRDHLEQIVEKRTEELVILNEDLTRATHAKDDFLASMSHELRTPLNSIIGFTDLMLKGLTGEVNEEQRRQLGMVHQSGQQLLSLVSEVLELSRINAGRLKVVPTEFSPAESVGRLVEMMLPLAEAHQIALTWRVEDGAPPLIRSDRGKVDQIILNLLSNAIKFTVAGEVEAVVAPVGSDSVTLSVRDTGIGIPAEELDAIFEHFHQADHVRAEGLGGTGLGLSISRRLAEALGGMIHVESEPGTGSTFTLTLPVDVPPLPDEA